MRSVFAILLLLAACRTQPLDFDGGVPGSDLATGTTTVDGGGRRDMSGPRDLAGSPTSCCGKQGNPGNELGVGRFCQDSLDCQSVSAKICASTFSATLTFCTMTCSQNGAPNQCGSGAQCQCSANGQCACVPGECTMPPPGC
jgi:hypothetical protein